MGIVADGVPRFGSRGTQIWDTFGEDSQRTKVYLLNKWGYGVFFLPRKSGAKNITPNFIEKKQ